MSSQSIDEDAWSKNKFLFFVQSLLKTMESTKQHSGEFDTEGAIFQDKTAGFTVRLN